MRTGAAVLGIVILGLLLGACRHPTESAPPPPKPSLISQQPLVPVFPPTEEPPVPSRTPSPSRSGSPSPTGFSEAYVSYCNGRPSGDQVIAAVRRFRSNLPSGSGVSVQKAPECAGIWQYTVLNVAESEPLQVITKGDPASLTVVTLGTDPCTVEVRAAAPPALLGTVGC
ncbi:hypothetical protein [Dactylosporangium sp. CA-233914]|uniref:hypothetical protein n=1 Tax=Dactylosporangium sp. CA-233914 TaxID=3239934 RepID=UPI003D93D975